jgi:hypothetical protein
MSKVILWTIKIALILVVIICMTLAKEMGISPMLYSIIGLAIIVPVWKYKSDEPKNDNNSQQLDKS